MQNRKAGTQCTGDIWHTQRVDKCGGKYNILTGGDRLVHLVDSCLERVLLGGELGLTHGSSGLTGGSSGLKWQSRVQSTHESCEEDNMSF
jgi:hypothetical protein